MPEEAEIIEPIAAPEVAGIGDKVTTSKPLQATTTEQEDMVAAGQRRVNIIWEKTQRIIALTVIVSAISVCMFIVVSSMILKREITPTAVQSAKDLVGLALLIVGFYFSRTNHTNTGGVGRKDQDRTR